MRASLPASLVLHGSVIAIAVIGLSFGEPLPPPAEDSISIDLVPVSAFTNIRAGTEQSKVIETETPSVVDTPEPPKIAERTGNTEEDQPKPLETANVTPAPTVNTAPEPEVVPDPAPEPDPAEEFVVDTPPVTEEKPIPVPEPDPVPEPVTPEPELVTEATVPDTPAVVAPHPVLRTAKLEQARTDARKKREEEQKRRAAEVARKKQEDAREADRISSIINAEDSRGATTGAGGQASAGKPTGQAALLTQSELDKLAAQMRGCWAPPPAALDVAGLTVRLVVDLNRDGTVGGTPKVLTEITSPIVGATASAAIRAIQRCGPYILPADKYDTWSQVDVTFDPQDTL